MSKSTLLYVSPFWPKKSGISEYSEGLIEGLCQNFDLTILTDGYTPTNIKTCDKYKVVEKQEKICFDDYQNIIYNIGNNPDFHNYMYDMLLNHPGYIILHDFILYYLSIGHYSKKMLFQKVYEMEGPRGIQIIRDSLKQNFAPNLLEHKEIAALLPLNKEIISAAKGVFVHSNYTKDLVLAVDPMQKVFVINAYMKPFNEKLKNNYLRSKYKIDRDSFLVGSFGLIAGSKQNDLICQAVTLYNKCHDKKIVYVMCGEGDFADKYLGENILKTGFLNNADFASALKDCDLVTNLRFPYNGETSATLLQAMAMEKACITTDIGGFSEIPDDCVEKVPYNITAEELMHVMDKTLLSNKKDLGKKAYEYVTSNAFTKEGIAENIRNYING